MTQIDFNEIKKQTMQMLLREGNNKSRIINYMEKYVNNDDLKEYFKNNYNKEKFKKAWRAGHSNNYYYASNIGNVRLNIDGYIIPQHYGNYDGNDKGNIYLDIEKFAKEHTDHPEYIKLAKYEKVYNFIASAFMKKEYNDIKKRYPNEILHLHHIYNSGDNRLENLIYLPESIHNKINHKKNIN